MEELFEEKTPETNFSEHSAHKTETLEPVVETPETAASCQNGKTAGSEEKIYESSATETNEEVNLKPVFVSSEGESLENEPDKLDLDVISPTESAPMSYQEAEVNEVLSAQLPETSVGGENPKIEETETASPNQIELGVFNIKEETPDYAVGEKSPSTENPVAAEQPIAMPEAEFPAAESCPPSRFDSVSIMEKPIAVVESSEKIETGDAIQEPPQAESSEIASGTAGEEKESRSYTTPNIGGSDTDGKNKTKLKPLDEGTVLNGRYEIIRKIGGGGMGAVYLASDKNLGGVLRAVKEMVQSYIEDKQQEKAASDFKRESLLLTSLDHQSIPTIYDYFFDDKEARFYLVMKYISGGDLAGRLRSAPESRIDEMSVTQWSIQIADVLDYLHNRQPPIVYRDLKPANIMVDGNSGRVMLIDFGIARWVNKEEKGVTAVGTMGYAPPELFSGNVEARSDIYSLGSTMFHLLTGADPQSNPLLIFDFQKHPRPRQINPQLSDQMERILMRSVEYNADKRFPSAADLRKALEEHLDNLKTNRVTFGVKEAPISVALSDQPVFCGFCGQKIVATDMFCAFCGAKQPLAQQGVHSHSEGYAPVPLTAQLLIIGTSELEQPAFRLEKDNNLVGRRDPMSNIFPEVDLSKFDPQTKISRRHARIWREGSEFMVEDLGSSNGTYILPVVSDTMRLQPHQPQLLTNGDKIRLGDTTLHFTLG
jgi:serine/threonine-protein kinase